MTREEENLVNMFRTTDTFLDTNNDILKEYAPIITTHTRLKNRLVGINQLFEIQTNSTKVQTGLKKNEKKELDRIMIKVSDAMSAEGAATDNKELIMIATWPKSLLNRLREGLYHVKVQQVYKAALPLASKLAVWGVTLREIELLNTLSTSLQQRTPDIQNVKVVSKQASTELREKIVLQNNDIKESLDKLMKPLSNI